MSISIRTEGGVTVVDLNGSPAVGAQAAQLHTKIEGLVNKGIRKILINLRGSRLIDSSGVAALEAAKTAANRTGTSIKLLHVEDKVRGTLDLAGLGRAFDRYDDEIDAIRSFRS